VSFPGAALGVVEGAADVPLALAAPFGLLLVLIAVMPMTPLKLSRWWEKNYGAVAVGLGLLMMAYYAVGVADGTGEAGRTLKEYISFMCLMGAPFVVAGGIHIDVQGEATPRVNVAFLALGAVVANVLGVVGASMLLVRPWLRLNRARARPHQVVFFIFLISNIGGVLTPLGEPPLYLGYLSGVPFFWLAPRVFLPWLMTVGLVLAVFYALEVRDFKRRRTDIGTVPRQPTWRLTGLRNVPLLLAVVGAVCLPDKFPLRELALAATALASWVLTPRELRARNEFTFGPIKEVGLLFFGIFGTMMPALGYLAAHGQNFGCTRALEYYFGSGGLSSVLDNAPTYLNFLQLAVATAQAAHPAAFAAAQGHPAAMVRVLLAVRPDYVTAISLGAVFFGAMTYIGNGPNFMVKAIAQETGAPAPSFFGYIWRYSLPLLLPILVFVGWVFL
jgi:Na+/H+ antiporter NhaD/arsenite permease-like protein